MEKISPCPHCGSKDVYQNKRGISGGGYAANYLPGLGGFMHCARLYPAICEACGLTRFFVDEKTRARLSASPKWEKVRKF
jgi:hypothetical protein